MLEPDPDLERETENHRKTLRHFEHAGPRFYTFSCYKRLPLLGTAVLRTAFYSHLEQVRQRRAFDILAYCVMPEHVHLVIDPRCAENSASSLMFHLKKPFAAQVLDRWRQLNAPILKTITDKRGRPHFWLHSAGFDRNIRDHKLLEHIHYVHMNPVERGLCKRPIDWQWSSASWYADEQGPVLVKPVRA